MGSAVARSGVHWDLGNLRKQLYGMITFRLVAVTSMLVSQVFLQALAPGQTWNDRAFFIVLSTPYVLTFFYLIIAKLGIDDRVNAYLQFLGDVIVISAIQYLTGGLFSPFASLFFVVVIVSAMLLYRQGALIVASLSFVAYGTIIFVTFFNYLPRHPAFADQYEQLSTLDAYYWLFLYMFGFYSVAYLTSALSQSVRGERAKAEQSDIRVRELEEFHRTLVESMTVGLLTTDEEGRISFASSAAEEILGKSSDDLEGRTIDRELLPENMFAEVRAALAEEQWVRKEVLGSSSDDRGLQVGITVSRLGGPMAGYLFLLEDLTEIKRLEEELRLKDRMVALGEMAAGLAHEIRNPLASMTGSVEVLGRDLKLEGDHERLVNIVLRESKRLDGIIRDFLLYARPPRLERIQFDLSNLARETLELFRHSLEASDNLSVQLMGDEQVVCYGDPNQIRQVVWNLLRNARTSMPKGGTLEVEIDNIQPWVCLTLRDTGVGMTEEETQAAIEPFRSGSREGVGLGLTIVYRIIKDHGGDFRIQSVKGEGTQVSVFLPESNRMPRTSPKLHEVGS